MPVNFYEAVWIFLIYAFFGWCCEVAFAAVTLGKFVNRGFLNGPVCPIYGFGMLMVVTALWQLRSNLILMFLGAAVVTTLLELVTGFVLEKCFHDKWWDYSDMPFNIKGYVCLKFTLLWGLAATFVIEVVHRFIYFIVHNAPFTLGLILLLVFAAIFFADLAITLVELIKLPKKLKAILETEKLLTAISEKIGENISDTTLAAKDKGTEFVEEKKPQFEEKKAELEEKRNELIKEFDKKKQEYQHLLTSKNLVHKRIVRAFPRLKEGYYKAAFEKISAAYAARQEKNDETEKQL